MMELGNTPRDLSIEDQVPLIQDFVQHPHRREVPAGQALWQPCSSHDEARWIAERKGGDYKSSRAWPGLLRPRSRATRSRFPPSVSRFCVTGTAGPTPLPSGTSINGIDTPYQIHGGVCMSGDFMNESNLLEAWRRSPA